MRFDVLQAGALFVRWVFLSSDFISPVEPPRLRFFAAFMKP